MFSENKTRKPEIYRRYLEIIQLLDDLDGTQRRKDLLCLLEYINEHQETFYPEGPIIISGDFTSNGSVIICQKNGDALQKA